MRLRPALAVTALLTALPLPTPGSGPVALAAQEAAAPRVAALPSSTRGMALGGAFMTDGAGSEALFVHPALLLDAEGFGLQLQTWSGEATSAQASAAGSWFGGDVGVGVGVRTLQYSVAGDGSVGLGGAPDGLFSDGGTPVSERSATLGLAKEVFGVDLGLTGSLVEQRVGGARDAGASVDVGLATEAGPFTVALSARNLGPGLELPGGEVSLPRRYELGAGAYGREVGPLDVGIAASVLYDETWDEVVPGAGLEVGYWPVRGRTFVARAGVRRVPEGEGSPFSAGLAFWGDDLVLEWAWRPFGDPVDEATHRFSVGWR